MDHNEIISLYKKDEKKAFRCLFDIFYEPLLMYAARILQDPKAAEDVVQDCFVNLWVRRRLDGFEGELDRFLFRSVKQTALNHIRTRERKKKLHKTAGEDHAAEHGASPAEEEPKKGEADLYAAVNSLPDRCRTIFLMACLDGMKYQEIADALLISINSVKTQMKIALKYLRTNLK